MQLLPAGQASSQLPQCAASLCRSTHASPQRSNPPSQPHAPQAQAGSQLRSEFSPQLWVAPGWQAPSPLHSDQVMIPVAGSQALVWLPQSPQARVIGAGQV